MPSSGAWVTPKKGFGLGCDMIRTNLKECFGGRSTDWEQGPWLCPDARVTSLFEPSQESTGLCTADPSARGGYPLLQNQKSHPPPMSAVPILLDPVKLSPAPPPSFTCQPSAEPCHPSLSRLCRWSLEPATCRKGGSQQLAPGSVGTPATSHLELKAPEQRTAHTCRTGAAPLQTSVPSALSSSTTTATSPGLPGG